MFKIGRCSKKCTQSWPDSNEWESGWHKGRHMLKLFFKFSVKLDECET